MTGTKTCEQRCGQAATVYAMDSIPGGWGGFYCEPCAKALNFQITDTPSPPAPMVGLLLLDARQQMIEGGPR